MKNNLLKPDGIVCTDKGVLVNTFIKLGDRNCLFTAFVKKRQVQNEVDTSEIAEGKGNWPKRLNFGKGGSPQSIADMMLGSVREISFRVSYEKYFLLFILTYNQPTKTTALRKCSLHSYIACESGAVQ